jgi:hypothetical protein
MHLCTEIGSDQPVKLVGKPDVWFFSDDRGYSTVFLSPYLHNIGIYTLGDVKTGRKGLIQR